MTFLGRLLLVILVLVKPAVAAPGSVEPGGDEQPFELPWADIPTSPEGAWATVRSEVLPELQARTQKARLLVGERKAFFEGESSLISAFPRLSSGQLNEPTVLEAELLVLDDRGIARAQLRVVDLPNFARKEQTASLKAALKQTLDQEEAADGLARRFLLSLRSHLLARPELVESELAKLREPWLATIAASRDLPDTLSEVERRERLQASRLASDDLVRLQWVVEELRMGALVSSRAAPQVDEGLELLSEVHRASAAAGRLELLLPALPADTQADVRRALNESRRVQEESDSALELRAATADVEAANQEDLEDISALSKDAVEELEQSLTSVLTEQQAALDAVAQARNRLEGDADDGARRLLDVQFEAAESRVLAARIRLERIQAHLRSAVDVNKEANAAESRVEQATEEAEQARRDAQDAQERRTAAILESRERTQKRASALWVPAREIESREGSEESGRRERLESLRTHVDAIEAMSQIHPDRPNPDAQYSEVRSLLKTMRTQAGSWSDALLEAQGALAQSREEADQEQQKIRDNLAQLDDIVDASQRLRRENALEAWQEALNEEHRAAEAAVKLAREARYSVLQDLEQAQTLRRRLSPYIGRSERDIDRANMLVEAGQELALAGPGLLSFHRDRMELMTGLPARLMDMSFVSVVLQDLFWIGLLLASWLWLRRNGTGWTEQIVARVMPSLERLRESEREAVLNGAQRFRIALVDAVASSCVLPFAPEGLPEVHVLLLVVFEVALFRLCLAIYDLVAVEEPSTRPGLIRLTSDSFGVIRRVAVWLLLWFVTRNIALTFGGEIINGYAVEHLLRFVFNILLLILVLVLLHFIAPVLRTRIARQPQQTRLVQLLSKKPPVAILNALQASGGLLFVIVIVLWDLTFLMGKSGGRVGRVLNQLSRFRLTATESDDATRTPVPDAVRKAIRSKGCPPEDLIQREEMTELMDQALVLWGEQRRRGLVAVLGDEGEGKATAFDALCERWEDSAKLPIRRLRMKTRLANDSALFEWLSTELGLKGIPTTTDELVNAVEEQVEKGIFVLEDVHLAFLRSVGGFQALRSLIYVLNATAENHFWVVGMHRPAWRYLSRLGDLLNLDVIKTVVELRPMGEEALRQVSLRRIERSGYTVDFSGVVRRNALGADPEQELERTISIFFRLLAEASAGNPSVALALWEGCLEDKKDGSLLVHMDDGLIVRPIPGLTEAEMFTLVALRTQDAMEMAEVARVTNMSPTQVRTTVKHLLGRGILLRHDMGVRIATAFLPAVTLTLRRRHFLHWAV